MTQHIQLQEVFFHRVIFKMGCDLVRIRVISRMLHRAEIPNLILLRNNHKATGMLTGGTAYTHAAGCKPSHFHRGCGFSGFLQIFLHIAKCRLFRHCTNGTGPENVGFSEHFDTICVGICLVFT